MHLLLTINRYLWAALLFAEAVLIIRLMRERLISRFPIFSSYITLELIAGTVLFWIRYPGPSLAFARMLQTYTMLTPLLRAGVAYELYERICQHFPGIERFRLRLAGILVLTGAFLALWSIPMMIAERWGFPRQSLAFESKQYGNEVLAFLLIGIWLFFRFFRITPRYRPNVLAHWRITTLFFVVNAGHAVAILAGMRSAQVVYPANIAMMSCDLVLFAAWTICLRRSGERLPSHQFSPSEIEELEERNNVLVQFITNLPRQIALRSK